MICDLTTGDGLALLRQRDKGSVDLVLTDPPYCISRESGFQSGGGVPRFAISMDFGPWDWAEIDLTAFANAAYDALREGGTAIVFYDLWKLTHLADAMKAAGFSKLRFLEWLKVNPPPINSKSGYLANAREAAICAVKGGKATFNSEHDNGLYHFPIPHPSERLHPAQKPLDMFRALIRKHSRPGDLVADPFSGSGTTAVAAQREGRAFVGCELDADTANRARGRLANETMRLC